MAIVQPYTGSGAATPSPQGRLTLRSGEPVMMADKTAATTIYYASFVGKTYPNWDGAALIAIPITGDEISCGLDAGVPRVVSGKVYDIYGTAGAAIGIAGPWLNAFQVITDATNATPIVVTANAHNLANGDIVFIAGTQGNTAANGRWVAAAVAANTFELTGSVGNGAYTAGTGSLASRGDAFELEMTQVVHTNKNSITNLWGGAAGTTDLGVIAANEGTCLGSVYATANGQTEMTIFPAAAALGTNNILGLYNAYNRVNLSAVCRDSTASWTYGTGTWRPLNGASSNVNNRITYLDGLGQSPAIATLMVSMGPNATTATWGYSTVSFDTITNAPDTGADAYLGTVNHRATVTSSNRLLSPGLHRAQAMELAALSTVKFYGVTRLALDFMN